MKKGTSYLRHLKGTSYLGVATLCHLALAADPTPALPVAPPPVLASAAKPTLEAQAAVAMPRTPGPLETPLTLHEFYVGEFCGQVEKLFARHNWGDPDCRKIPFKVMGWSVQGRPLVLFEHGPTEGKLTLVQCGIHGDEYATLPLCIRMIHEIMTEKRLPPKGTRLVVQPLLNPDGMLRAERGTRGNANGVDINRNFATGAWGKEAVASWKRKDKQDPRKFPGHTPASEPETQSITRYIEREKPQKIISLHTPLGFLDLDFALGNKDQERRARWLATAISKNTGNYAYRHFGVYPGSLGNYAGRERGIPVYTLEIPPGQRKEDITAYWTRFRVGLWRAVDFDMDRGKFYDD